MYYLEGILTNYNIIRYYTKCYYTRKKKTGQRRWAPLALADGSSSEVLYNWDTP